MPSPKKDAKQQAETSIANLRGLIIDATNNAKSGHPGMALDAAPALYALYHDHLMGDPRNPHWYNRDRFVLSSGHNSALLYSMLHICGYPLGMDDMKKFRQYRSLTPGHPEVVFTPGVDATSGPLGQGIAQAVGFAIAEDIVRNSYPDGEMLCNHRTYCFCGDGCLMEGVAQEAISLAGHLRLNKLILIYDENGVTLDGPTADSFDENVKLRFMACNWDVIEVEDGNDYAAVSKAIGKAKKSVAFPTLIIIHTKIGYGTEKEGSSSCHGSPLGKEIGDKAKANYGLSSEEFHIDQSVYDDMAASFASRGGAAYEDTQRLWKEYEILHPEAYATFRKACLRDVGGAIPESMDFGDKDISTRAASGKILNLLTKNIPFMVGGSADVASSVMTKLEGVPQYGKDCHTSHDIHFGIREFGMASCMNAMSLHGGLIPYCGSFMVFVDYFKAAIRMGAIEKTPSLYLLSHDSIAVGEDGPTHQPIEQLAMLRSIPSVRIYRPADAKETLGAYRSALAFHQGPSILILSRQNLPQLEQTEPSKVEEGAYLIHGDPKKAKLAILASGSEVSLALEAAKLLKKEVAIYSVPCLELLQGKDLDKVFALPYEKRVSLEMATTFGWAKYAKHNIGIDEFGASAPAKDVIKAYGFTPEAIAEKLGGLL